MADLPMTMAQNSGVKSLGGAKIKLITFVSCAGMFLSIFLFC